MSFYTEILPYYDQLFPLDQDKLKFALEPYGLSSSHHTTIETPRILDIGCATGNLSNALCEAGCEVIGIDIDKSIIHMAKNKFPIGPIFEAIDMIYLHQYYPPKSFDQVLCFGNTLAHLPNEMAVRHFFKAVAMIIKTDGLFKLEVLNYDQALEKGMLELPPIEVNGMVLNRHQCLEQQCMECYTELDTNTGETIQKNCLPLFPIRYSQIESLLEETGFAHIKHYADFNRHEEKGDHYNRIIEATKL